MTEHLLLFVLTAAVLCATVLTYMLITWTNKHTSSSVVSAFWTLQPLWTALLVWIFLKEIISLQQTIGGLLILSGLIAVLVRVAASPRVVLHRLTYRHRCKSGEKIREYKCVPMRRLNCSR